MQAKEVKTIANVNSFKKAEIENNIFTLADPKRSDTQLNVEDMHSVIAALNNSAQEVKVIKCNDAFMSSTELFKFIQSHNNSSESKQKFRIVYSDRLEAFHNMWLLNDHPSLEKMVDNLLYDYGSECQEEDSRCQYPFVAADQRSQRAIVLRQDFATITSHTAPIPTFYSKDTARLKQCHENMSAEILQSFINLYHYANDGYILLFPYKDNDIDIGLNSRSLNSVAISFSQHKTEQDGTKAIIQCRYDSKDIYQKLLAQVIQDIASGEHTLYATLVGAYNAAVRATKDNNKGLTEITPRSNIKAVANTSAPAAMPNVQPAAPSVQPTASPAAQSPAASQPAVTPVQQPQIPSLQALEERLKSEQMELNQTISKLEKQQSYISIQEKEIGTIKEKMKKIEEGKARSSQLILEKEKELRDKQGKLTTLEKHINDRKAIETAIEDIDKKLQTILQECNAQKRKEPELAKDLKLKETALEQMRSKLSEHQREYSNLEPMIPHEYKSLSDIQIRQEIKKHEDNIQNIATEINAYNSEYTARINNLKLIAEENKGTYDVMPSVLKLTSASEEMRNQYLALSDELQNKVLTLNNALRLSELNEIQQQCKVQIEKIKSDIKSVNEQQETLRDNYRDNIQQKAFLETDKRLKVGESRKIPYVNDSYKQPLTEDVSKLTVEIREIKSTMERAKEEYSKSRESLESLTLGLADMVSSKNNLQASVDSLRSHLAETERLIAMHKTPPSNLEINRLATMMMLQSEKLQKHFGIAVEHIDAKLSNADQSQITKEALKAANIPMPIINNILEPINKALNIMFNNRSANSARELYNQCSQAFEMQ